MNLHMFSVEGDSDVGAHGNGIFNAVNCHVKIGLDFMLCLINKVILKIS